MRSDTRNSRNKAYDDRRNAENPTRRLYKTARWQKLRAEQLQREPHCRMCAVGGYGSVATVCDHIERHGGDVIRFWAGPFQSLCAPCHNRSKQRHEHLGFSTAIGADGWPLDPQHYANRGGRK